MTMNSKDWNDAREASALAFHEAFEEIIRRKRAADRSPLDSNGGLPMEVSFARGRSSQNWFTSPVSWGVFLMLLGTELEETDKDGIIFCAGPLKHGTSENGTRKIKEHVEGLNLVVLDFDKGDAPLNDLRDRLNELSLEGAAYATFTDYPRLRACR